MPAPLDCYRLALAGAGALLCCTSAAAQNTARNIDPGLWEMKTETQFLDRPDMAAQIQQAQEELKNLPPETRKMLEERMGVGMGPGNSIRLCITPEEVRESLMYEGKKEEDCTYTQVSQSGNTWKGHVRCTEPPNQGDFTTTMHSSTRYSTLAVLKNPEYGRVTMQIEARRMGSDCGSLRKANSKR